MANAIEADIRTPRLTELAHGGGCGCKLSPAVLREILAGQMAMSGMDGLLVGNGDSDDAAVWAMDAERCIVATTDFFMPIVDDPRDFGRIAATNAISDIYAMGARPLFALAILGMPIGKVAIETVRAIAGGGAEVCREAGIPVAGGHSIDSAEPIYGLAVVGEVARANLRTNGGAQPGDALILTKPLGVGIYSAALKRTGLAQEDYAAMLATTTQLNTAGMRLGREAAVHAITDVTGFGIAGHALEMARAAGLSVELDFDSLPLLPRAADWAAQGIVTGASGRNWDSAEGAVNVPATLSRWQRDLLTDPQTSGGLLVAVASQAAQAVLEIIRSEGFGQAAIVGSAGHGKPGVTIRHS